jgi:hypothetical protein
MPMSLVRLHDGAPFCYTRVHVSMELGRRPRGLPELAGLAEPGARGRVTMISLIDRLYRNRELRPLELAVNHFNPDRYSCRLPLRRADPAGAGAGSR